MQTLGFRLALQLGACLITLTLQSGCATVHQPMVRVHQSSPNTVYGLHPVRCGLVSANSVTTHSILSWHPRYGYVVSTSSVELGHTLRFLGNDNQQTCLRLPGEVSMTAFGDGALLALAYSSGTIATLTMKEHVLSSAMNPSQVNASLVRTQPPWSIFLAAGRVLVAIHPDDRHLHAYAPHNSTWSVAQLDSPSDCSVQASDLAGNLIATAHELGSTTWRYVLLKLCRGTYKALTSVDASQWSSADPKYDAALERANRVNEIPRKVLQSQAELAVVLADAESKHWAAVLVNPAGESVLVSDPNLQGSFALTGGDLLSIIRGQTTRIAKYTRRTAQWTVVGAPIPKVCTRAEAAAASGTDIVVLCVVREPPEYSRTTHLYRTTNGGESWQEY